MGSRGQIAAEFERLLGRLPTGNVAMACVASDGRFIGANPAFCEMAGRAEPELAETLLVDLIHPDDRGSYVELLAALRAGDVPSFETRSCFAARGGTPIWVQASVSAVTDERGEVEYLVVLAHDVTEWRSAEEQNTQLFGFPLALVFVAGLDGYFRRVGAGYERLLGWTEQELLSRPFFEFLHPDDLATLGASIQEVAAGGAEVSNQEIRVRHKDGTYRWLMGNYRPVPDEGVMYGIAVDITARRHAEEALRESEERTRLILDTSFEAFISIDLEGRIVEWNVEAARLFGWPREEVIGRVLADTVVPHRYRTAHTDGLAHYRATGEGPLLGQRVEIEGLRRDGTEFPMELTISSSRTDTTVVFNAFLHDITERKTAETSLTAAKAEAEQAREEAERASQAKSEFVSRMSHELRTPLNAVLGFAQLMRIGTLSPEHSDSVEQIIRGGQHLLQLIEELLDLARIEQGSISLSIEPVHLDEVVREALELIRPLAAPANIRIWTEASQLDRHALADRQRLKQVLMNLLSNAIKYNRSGGTVTITCEPVGDRLRIAVADTGPGVPPEMVDRLFMPFERLGAEHTAVQGTGIGLSISKHLVELMAGDIGVESTGGQGSTFWIELDPVHDPFAHVEQTIDTAERPQPPDGSGRTVLYVEDNLSNLHLVERILAQRPGIRLVAAMQGSLALDLAHEHRPELVLLDVHLPDIDGDEVLRRLRADPVTRNIPVAVVSAEATPRKIERFLAAGAMAYLTKPLDVNRLLEVVDGMAAPPEPEADVGPGTTPAQSEDEPLDPTLIASLRDLDNATAGSPVGDLITQFIEESLGRLAALREAAAGGDAAAVARLAHALRGGSANLGARLLPELCLRLETLATSGLIRSTDDLLAALEAELHRVHAALQHEFPPPR